MPGKKPGSKTSKLKKATSAKAAPRRAAHSRPEPRKSVVASRRAAPAAAATPASAPAPAARFSRKSASDLDRMAQQRAAPIISTVSSLRPAAGGSTTARTRLLPETEEVDAEGEAADTSSLLAGPRNVKPYVAKRGEQYMSKQQLAHFQLILLNWKRDLMEEVDRTVSHMKDEAANFPDPNDRATQEEEFSLELRTRDRERKLIRKIDEALKRIEDGTYGYCLETGEEIGIKRLEARPVATLSIEAQERRERRERQYGDRDDRYR
ncbi:MAG TPA: RNA polymerase-binding protein DksA [Steroidobacteraceae bacterium]|nr:RNA polymerase-binding protein DksA [Steroidobacteraceae bacterium]